MTEKKKISLSGWRAYVSIIVALSLLCIVVFFACFQYYIRLQDTVASENAGYLQEISKQIGVNAGSIIEDNFSILGAVTTVLKTANITTFDRLDDILQEQQRHWDFDRILLVDAHGVAYDADGHTVLLDGSAYLQEAIVARNRAMSTSQLLGDKECVVFAVPIDALAVEGIEMAALVATYDLATFDRILSMTAFDGKGYAHIIRRDGTMVIRSSSAAAPQTGYNILTSMADAPFSGSVTAADVLSDIAGGRSGQARLTLDGVPLYMSYTPLSTQEWCLLTFVPTSVATAKSTLFLNITLLLGLLIAVVFSLLLAVLMFTFYRHRCLLEQLAFVDPVTGGNTIQRFYTQAAALLTASGGTAYALVYTNIDKFKVLNEQLGRAACDVILTAVSKSIRQDLSAQECSGRQFADNFCMLIRYRGEADLSRRLSTWTENYNRMLTAADSARLPLVFEVGVYVIEDRTLPIPDMVDRAKLALREMPREATAQVHYRIYDEQVRRLLLREKQLEDMMTDALEKHEFVVYLQPKYNTDCECIGGAEALVRWDSPTQGMIYPDEFISLFEKNGFIVRLDLWVFEQVCKTLRAWLDRGYTPVRISVNCSRVHLKMPGFLEQYRSIAARYAVPPDLLEIELTENVVFEDVAFLTGVIEKIHVLGFHCSMDDFGSGYSSLKLIQDIPVDVLKLDRVFFRSGAADLARTESVVGCIITMARALSMETVAEGVEERIQVDMLKRLGCDYIQGFYFARPMPIERFEALAFGAAEITDNA